MILLRLAIKKISTFITNELSVDMRWNSNRNFNVVIGIVVSWYLSLFDFFFNWIFKYWQYRTWGVLHKTAYLFQFYSFQIFKQEVNVCWTMKKEKTETYYKMAHNEEIQEKKAQKIVLSSHLLFVQAKKTSYISSEIFEHS